MTTVVLADTDFEDCELERRELGTAGVDLVVASSSAADDVVGAAPTAEGLLVMWCPVDAAMMDRLPRLRAIGRFGTGVDTIDVNEATRRGVAVVNSGHYASVEVAAHTVALSLALLRRLGHLDRAMRDGQWDPVAGAAGTRRITSLRAGVVGLGEIGSTVAAQLAALGMTVAAYDPVAMVDGVQSVDTLDELLRSSDLVTLHVPLLEETRGLISRAELDLMPRGSFLVNTARGPIVDESALISALRSGQLAGAALDVFEIEPLADDHPLRSLPNVVLTPHVAYYSEEALVEARTRTVAALAAVLTNRKPRDLVNPAYLAHVPTRATTTALG